MISKVLISEKDHLFYVSYKLLILLSSKCVPIRNDKIISFFYKGCPFCLRKLSWYLFKCKVNLTLNLQTRIIFTYYLESNHHFLTRDSDPTNYNKIFWKYIFFQNRMIRSVVGTISALIYKISLHFQVDKYPNDTDIGVFRI